MKRLLTLALFLASGLLVASVLTTVPAAVYAADDVPAGQEVFVASKCNMCHGVASAGIEAKTKSEKMKGPDLDGCCADKDAEWLSGYLKKEVELDGSKHKGSFKGTDEELATLIEWLKGL